MKLKVFMLIVLSAFSMPSYSQTQISTTTEQAPVTLLPTLSLTAISADEELPSVTTLSRDDIEKAGIQSWQDVGRIEPSLNFDEQKYSLI